MMILRAARGGSTAYPLEFVQHNKPRGSFRLFHSVSCQNRLGASLSGDSGVSRGMRENGTPRDRRSVPPMTLRVSSIRTRSSPIQSLHSDDALFPGGTRPLERRAERRRDPDELALRLPILPVVPLYTWGSHPPSPPGARDQILPLDLGPHLSVIQSPCSPFLLRRHTLGEATSVSLCSVDRRPVCAGAALQVEGAAWIRTPRERASPTLSRLRPAVRLLPRLAST